MIVSTHEFSVQEADLLPAREALQTAPWDMLSNLLNGALGVPGSASMPGANTGDSALGSHPGSHPGGYLHAGPRPMPAIM